MALAMTSSFMSETLSVDGESSIELSSAFLLYFTPESKPASRLERRVGVTVGEVCADIAMKLEWSKP